MKPWITVVMCGVLSCCRLVWGEHAPECWDLKTCVRHGLAQNLRLRNAELDERIAAERAISATGLFDPFLSASASHTDSEITDARSFLTNDKQITDYGAELRKTFSTGTRLAVSADQSRLETGGTNLFRIPPYSSRVGISVSQSILKNAFGDIDRNTLRHARAGRTVAEHLHKRERQLLSLQICEAYWDLHTAGMSYAVGLDSLGRARALLASNRGKLEDGLLDETDILAAEARIATRSVDVLALSNRVEDARDSLRNIIQVPVDSWDSVRFSFPGGESVRSAVKPFAVGSGSARKTALRLRPDLQALKGLAEQAGMDLQIKQSRSRHDLELVAGLARGSSGESSGESRELDDPEWMVGLQLDVPLRRTSEKSAVRQSELGLTKRKNDVALLEDAIALECLSTARLLSTGCKRVAATEKVVNLQQKKLKQERKKFEQGRSSTHWVIQFEDDFDYASKAYHVALAEYQKAVARYRFAQGQDPVEVEK